MASTAMSSVNSMRSETCTRRLTATAGTVVRFQKRRPSRSRCESVTVALIRPQRTPQPETTRRFVTGLSSAPFGSAPRVLLLGFQNPTPATSSVVPSSSHAAVTRAQ